MSERWSWKMTVKDVITFLNTGKMSEYEFLMIKTALINRQTYMSRAKNILNRELSSLDIKTTSH